MEKDHFESYFRPVDGQSILFPWQRDFELFDGYYQKIVGEADLDVGFDDDNDRKFYAWTE